MMAFLLGFAITIHLIGIGVIGTVYMLGIIMGFIVLKRPVWFAILMVLTWSISIPLTWIYIVVKAMRTKTSVVDVLMDNVLNPEETPKQNP